MKDFGSYLRSKRLLLQNADASFSVRGLAARIEVEPSYLSKIERGIEAPPSEEKIRRIAKELDEDPDVLLALAGKVSADLRKIIMKRPLLFSTLIRELKQMPDHAVLRIARMVRDGDW